MPQENPINPLTKREFEIMKLIITEHSNAQIAEMLFLSTKTVETHRRNLLNKLNLNSALGLLRWAINNNLDN
jgi:DNA-binding CsgD family transcriptional regulator